MSQSQAIDLGAAGDHADRGRGAPVLLTGLVIGLVISVLQAVTQIQEYTLSFVPKIIAMLAALLLVGPWMISRLVEFSRAMFGSLP